MAKTIYLNENQYSLLLEYFDKEHLMPLKRYFNMSDDEKSREVAYLFNYLR